MVPAPMELTGRRYVLQNSVLVQVSDLLETNTPNLTKLFTTLWLTNIKRRPKNELGI